MITEEDKKIIAEYESLIDEYHPLPTEKQAIKEEKQAVKSFVEEAKKNPVLKRNGITTVSINWHLFLEFFFIIVLIGGIVYGGYLINQGKLQSTFNTVVNPAAVNNTVINNNNFPITNSPAINQNNFTIINNIKICNGTTC